MMSAHHETVLPVLPVIPATQLRMFREILDEVQFVINTHSQLLEKISVLPQVLRRDVVVLCQAYVRLLSCLQFVHLHVLIAGWKWRVLYCCNLYIGYFGHWALGQFLDLSSAFPEFLDRLPRP